MSYSNCESSVYLGILTFTDLDAGGRRYGPFFSVASPVFGRDVVGVGPCVLLCPNGLDQVPGNRTAPPYPRSLFLFSCQERESLKEQLHWFEGRRARLLNSVRAKWPWSCWHRYRNSLWESG